MISFDHPASPGIEAYNQCDARHWPDTRFNRFLAGFSWGRRFLRWRAVRNGDAIAVGGALIPSLGRCKTRAEYLAVMAADAETRKTEQTRRLIWRTMNDIRLQIRHPERKTVMHDGCENCYYVPARAEAADEAEARAAWLACRDRNEGDFES